MLSSSGASGLVTAQHVNASTGICFDDPDRGVEGGWTAMSELHGLSESSLIEFIPIKVYVKQCNTNKAQIIDNSRLFKQTHTN